MSEEEIPMERKNYLLAMAADYFDHLASPFATEVLAKHKVKPRECGWLSQEIANRIEPFEDTDYESDFDD
jgi:hypothetical protein